MIEFEKKIVQQTLNILKKKSWNDFSLEQVLKSVKVKKTNIKTLELIPIEKLKKFALDIS